MLPLRAALFVLSLLATETALTPAERTALVSRGHFRAITALSSVPGAIRAALPWLYATPDIADPGEPFNATDVVDPRLPPRRLIFAASSPDLFLFHYERGGRGHSYYILCYRVSPAKAPVLIWAASAHGRFRSIQALQDAIQSNQVAVSLQNVW